MSSPITRLRIEHDSMFTYDAPVFLEPHTLRLRPRHTFRQQLRDFTMHVEPEPAMRADNLGLHETETILWFHDLTDHLRVRTACVVDVFDIPPFSFLLADDFLAFPVQYPALERSRLQTYLERRQIEDSVITFAASVAEEAGGQVIGFLSALARRTWAEFDKPIREDGDPMLPAETLTTRSGACRDLAELYVDACRTLGLAARFVSGYSESEVVDDVRYLHAWAEVYLPGGGWRGFDPSFGIAVGNRHVAIAHGPSFAEARPIDGTYRGTGIGSTMKAHIDMSMTILTSEENG